MPEGSPEITKTALSKKKLEARLVAWTACWCTSGKCVSTLNVPPSHLGREKDASDRDGKKSHDVLF